ncbi:MAG: hypothetical protein RLZZ106_1069, partial [Cyanobacteriota bacterium]
MGALGLGVLLLGLAIGVLPLSGPLKLGLLVALWLALLVGLRRRPRLLVLLALLLPLLLARGLIGQPHPGAADPLHRIPVGAQQQAVVLTARLLEDPRPD